MSAELARFTTKTPTNVASNNLVGKQYVDPELQELLAQQMMQNMRMNEQGPQFFTEQN
jgi:hypothetical protein